MELELTVHEFSDDWGKAEQVTGKTTCGTLIDYYADYGGIGASFFSAGDYVEALELGMKLAKEGYTSISVNWNYEEG